MRTRGAAWEGSTVLELGARGAVDERAFVLAGRTCVQGRRGALWNEWSLRFDDGKTSFLAEANGTFTLYDEGTLTPSWDALVAGAPVDTGWIVVERGTAARVAQWGEVEDAPPSYAYADLSSRAGQSATIDFGGGPPRVFLGRRLKLADLALVPRAAPPCFVRAPEVSRPKGVDLWLEVGDEGVLDGVRFRVVGVLSRSSHEDAVDASTERITWDEYLLHDAHAGLRWLVVSDGHWSLVEAIEAGRVREVGGDAELDGEVYTATSEGAARIDWATGELPWEAAIGDVSSVRDFVRAPYLLTKEWTADEVTWSRGLWLAPDVVAKAFDKRSLPRPIGRAPNAP